MAAIDHRCKTRFLAAQKFFDNDAATGIAKRLTRQHRLRSCASLFDRLRDDDTLAGSQTVGFDDDGGALLLNVFDRGSGVRKAAVSSSWNIAPHEKGFGEGLRALQLRSGAGRPKTAQAGLGELVDESGNQRRFRANDGQVDAGPDRKFQQTVEVLSADVNVGRASLQRRPRIAGGDKNFLHFWRLGCFPGERVFAPATANDHDFHGLVVLE